MEAANLKTQKTTDNCVVSPKAEASLPSCTQNTRQTGSKPVMLTEGRQIAAVCLLMAMTDTMATTHNTVINYGTTDV